jgi:UDP-glucose 4-epimerase
MRIVVTGATGNVGVAVTAALAGDGQVDEVVGIARREPPAGGDLARFVRADVARDELRDAFAGADAVVHLAWEIQPSRQRRRLWRTNVLGTRRVLDAAVAAGVRRVVAASSIGVYAPGPKDREVDESWPRTGVPTLSYSVDKVAMERLLDVYERRHPALEIVRLRPALIFQRESASEQRRLFGGPFVPGFLLRDGRLPVFPDVHGLRFQAVHATDVAEAYRLAVTAAGARGAYNVAAPPVLDLPTIAAARGARTVRLPRAVARPAFAAAYRARLHPSEPGWLDVALATPLISSARITAELGFAPRVSALDAVAELLDGIAAGAGAATPPLAAGGGVAGRLAELRGRVGGATPDIP